MFDFKLTERGDLDVEFGNELDAPQKVSFNVGAYEAQRIKFTVTPLKVPKKKSAEQRVSFRFVEMTPTSFQESCLQDEDELAQSLMLALRTESGDVYNSDVGSKLYRLRHKTITSKKDLKKIADAASVIVDEILPGATARVIDTEYPEAGFFRYESLLLEISYGGKKLIDYILE